MLFYYQWQQAHLALFCALRVALAPASIIDKSESCQTFAYNLSSNSSISAASFGLSNCTTRFESGVGPSPEEVLVPTTICRWNRAWLFVRVSSLPEAVATALARKPPPPCARSEVAVATAEHHYSGYALSRARK